MEINIKDQEAIDLANELASLTGQSLAEVVKTALKQELNKARVPVIETRPQAERLNEIALRCASFPDLDLRTADEIIGYDSSGLPTNNGHPG